MASPLGVASAHPYYMSKALSESEVSGSFADLQG